MFDMLSLPYRGVLVFICVSAVLFAIVYIVPLPTAQEKYLPFEEIPCPPRLALVILLITINPNLGVPQPPTHVAQ
jgi:hypothetical protein